MAISGCPKKVVEALYEYFLEDTVRDQPVLTIFVHMLLGTCRFINGGGVVDFVGPLCGPPFRPLDVGAYIG